MSVSFNSVLFFKRQAAVLIACLILLIGAGQFGVTRATSVSREVLVCVNKKSGVMRQVTKAKCAKTESFLRLTSGVAGATGAAGTTGAAGAAGANGEKGAVGETGAVGAKGETGAAGTNGVKGETGAAGTTGTAGAAGTTGTAGAAGTPGTPGATGPGTLWEGHGESGVGNLDGFPREVINDPVVVECLQPSTTPTYRLKMGASAREMVIATVSTSGVQGPTTYVLANSAVAQIGGDRTTNDLWEIRVFDSFLDNALKIHFLVRIFLSPNSCATEVWRTL